jgi:hypothetical protein
MTLEYNDEKAAEFEKRLKEILWLEKWKIKNKIRHYQRELNKIK